MTIKRIVCFCGLVFSGACLSADLQGQLKAVHPQTGDVFTPDEIKVVLRDESDGKVVDSAWTTQNGRYYFDDIEPGDYVVEVAGSGDGDAVRRTIRVRNTENQSIDTITLE